VEISIEVLMCYSFHLTSVKDPWFFVKGKKKMGKLGGNFAKISR
jgi:hypothetical protein